MSQLTPQIIRTVTKPDGRKVEFALSPLFQAFEQTAQELEAQGITIPAAVTKWHTRYGTVARVNGGEWRVADLGDVEEWGRGGAERDKQ